MSCTRRAGHLRETAPADSDVARSMALYVEARRSVIKLREAKWLVMWLAQSRFCKGGNEYQSLGRVCCWDPTENVRSLADDSACRYADMQGDDLFNTTVDGTALPAVTAWFYGHYLPRPKVETPLQCTERFTVSELMLLDDNPRLKKNQPPTPNGLEYDQYEFNLDQLRFISCSRDRLLRIHSNGPLPSISDDRDVCRVDLNSVFDLKSGITRPPMVLVT